MLPAKVAPRLDPHGFIEAQSIVKPVMKLSRHILSFKLLLLKLFQIEGQGDLHGIGIGKDINGGINGIHHMIGTGHLLGQQGTGPCQDENQP